MEQPMCLRRDSACKRLICWQVSVCGAHARVRTRVGGDPLSTHDASGGGSGVTREPRPGFRAAKEALRLSFEVDVGVLRLCSMKAARPVFRNAKSADAV